MAQAHRRDQRQKASGEQYISLSDLMAVLSGVAQDAKRPPDHGARLSPPLPTLKPNGSRPNNLVPLPRSQPKPHLPPPLAPLQSPDHPGASSLLQQTGTAPKTLEDLSQDLWEMKLVSLSDSDYYNREINLLKRRLWWVTGLAVGMIGLLVTALGWMAMNLKEAQMATARYEDAIATNGRRLEQLEAETLVDLETRLEQFQAGIPEDLAADVTTARKDLDLLKLQVSDMENTVNSHDKALSVLVSAMQGLVGKRE